MQNRYFMTETRARASLAALLLVVLIPALCRAQSPTVDRVEPPNWWVAHSVNPVRVLLHGENLVGAKVEASGGGVSASHVQASGTYVFVDVTIDPHARPGARSLKVTTPKGTVSAPFEIDAPLPTAGRFQGFSPDDVIYLIMPDRFSDGDPSNNDPYVSRGLFDRSNPHRYHGGDLQGIINHLDYLKSLGVTTLWLTPVYDNVNHLNSRETDAGNPISDYHGYGAVNFYGVEEHFGTLEKLRELVDKAHALGLKVIQDEVANHTSPYHPWAKDPPTPTWFNGTLETHLSNEWDIPVLTDPHAPPALQKNTLEGWFINILPDINQNDPEAARYEIQNTLWWLGETGFDGLREDTMSYVPRSFMRDWSGAIRRQYPNVTEVGEVYNGDVAVTSFFQGGQARFDGIDTGVSSLFDFGLYYPLRRVFAQGNSVKDLTYLLGRDSLYVNPNSLVTFLGSHDVPRFMNEQGATIDGLKLAQTFLLTTRGIPMLYYGDELALPGGGDPDNRRDFPGGFPGDALNAFTQAGRTAAQQDVFTHVQTLTHLRAMLPALRRGRLVNLYVSDQQYVYARVMPGTPEITQFAVVALNNDKQPATFTFPADPSYLPEGTTLTDRLGVTSPVSVQNGKVTLTLPARAGAILTRGTSPKG